MGGAGGTRRAARGASPGTRPSPDRTRPASVATNHAARPDDAQHSPSPPWTGGQARAYDTVVVRISRRRLTDGVRRRRPRRARRGPARRTREQRPRTLRRDRARHFHSVSWDAGDGGNRPQTDTRCSSCATSRRRRRPSCGFLEGKGGRHDSPAAQPPEPLLGQPGLCGFGRRHRTPARTGIHLLHEVREGVGVRPLRTSHPWTL